MHIDSHQHFWNLRGPAQVLSLNYVPADLKPIYDVNRFDGCVTVFRRNRWR